MIEQSDLDKHFISRIKGSLWAMKRPRTEEKLHSLEKIGIINNLQIASWKSVRPPKVHGDRKEIDKSFEKQKQDYFNILEMIYRIILYAIKYQGKYTAYGIGDEKELSNYKQLESSEYNKLNLTDDEINILREINI